MGTVKSALIWFGTAILALIWLPLLTVRRLLDRDPAHYYTGRLFRKLGKAFSRINPAWKITISGRTDLNDREPYVIVCNHQSHADIPLISNLPWEMKWVAKKALFNIPVAGWMMRLAGDIPIERHSRTTKDLTFTKARFYLKYDCSVIFFPEGTRSRTGKLRRFTKGAFELAINERVSVLPLVIDGTQNTLPKNTWKFGRAENIRLKVLDPVSTEHYGKDDITKLSAEVRTKIAKQLEKWRAER